jgi:predicted metal-dependent hydrolase
VVPKRSQAIYELHKEDARALVHAKIAQFNSFYQHTIKKVFIKNHRSRWGSCSSKGNLNFNYRLVHLPEHLADYVVVHELCHLKCFNHSADFWTLVAQALPDYKKLRAELRKVVIK